MFKSNEQYTRIRSEHKITRVQVHPVTRPQQWKATHQHHDDGHGAREVGRACSSAPQYLHTTIFGIQKNAGKVPSWPNSLSHRRWLRTSFWKLTADSPN